MATTTRGLSLPFLTEADPEQAGPLTILAADVADPLEDGGWYELEILLSALRKVAELLVVGTDTLYWDTACEACREIAERHGFLDRHPRRVPGPAYRLEIAF